MYSIVMVKLSKRFLVPLTIAAATLAGLCIVLLIPLHSDSHSIEFNMALKDKKEDYLESVSKEKLDSDRPNIVLIVADDLGKTDISLYGSPYVETPNIDAIAGNGVVFTDAYCSSPICSPSRAGLLTGRHQQRFGYETQPMNRYPHNRLEYLVYKYLLNTGNWQVSDLKTSPVKDEIKKQGLPPSEIILPEILKSSGYATAVTGKWHLGYNPKLHSPLVRGFDYMYGFYEAFSLFAPVDDPGIVNHRHDYFASKHIWRQGRKGYCAIRRNEEVISEERYLTFAIADEAAGFIEKNRDRPFFLYVPFSAPHTPFQVPREYYDRFDHVTDKNKRVYYGMIAALDDAVGTITDSVRELGLLDNTIILFTSDNGGATYTGATDNAPLKGGKFTSFEGGINIPMMIQWPAVIHSGTINNHPVSHLDIVPTLLAAAGIPLSDSHKPDGVDLIPWVTKTISGVPHESLFWRAHYTSAIREGRYKLFHDSKNDIIELYDLQADSSEKINLAQSDPGTVARLMEKIAEWERGMSDPAWPYVMDYHFTFDEKDYWFPL
jgi:arylsulfatase A-like enzyme